MLAIAEFQEFLSFYPTHARADYAQYKLGLAHFRQMRAPQRDQTETRDAIREFETFIVRYPNSEPDARGAGTSCARRATGSARPSSKSAASTSGSSWYPGAIDRLTPLLKDDPEFTGARRRLLLPRRIADKGGPQGRGAALFEKLVAEFEQSEYLEEAKKRIDEIKSATGRAATAARRR